MKNIYVVFVVLVSGCGPATKPPEVRENEIRIFTQFERASVQRVVLSDGTPCAVLNGSQGKGAIDCDWNHKAKPE